MDQAQDNLTPEDTTGPGRRDGTDLEAGAQPANNRPSDNLEVLWDIAEQRHAEQALRESERRLQQIASALREIIWLRDVKTRQVLYVNPAFEQLCGVPCEEFYKNPDAFGNLIHPDDLQRIMKKGSLYRSDIHRIVRPDGGIRWVWGRTFPVKNEAGEVYRTAAIVEDITERRQAEERIRQLNAELEQRVAERTAELSLARDAAEAANRAKSAFLTIMSHELRTPLNGIFLAAEMLREYGLPAAEQKNYADIILTAGRRLLHMVEGVLEYTVTDSQHMATELDVTLALYEVGLRFQAPAARKHLALTFDIAPNLPPLHADAHEFNRMLRRLVDNAIKFTPDGGQVTVKAERIPGRARPAPAPGPLPAHVLQISVTDTGPGLRPEDCERIFEPFVQLEDSYLKHAEGVGLGLTLARRQAEAHGGRLWAESEGEGKGSRFILTLPIF